MISGPDDNLEFALVIVCWTVLLVLVLVSAATTTKHSLRSELMQKVYRAEDANFLEQLPEEHAADGEPMKIHVRHTITHIHGIVSFTDIQDHSFHQK